MSFFSRRRLQAMLNDLNAHLTGSKRTDIINRIESKHVEQSLPGEMELALTWMFSNRDDLEVEPHWWAEGSKPDLYLDRFINGRPAVIEVACVSDNSMSGEDQMISCAAGFVAVANRLEKGLGQYLRFYFGDYTEVKKGRRVRTIAAPLKYVPSPEVESAMSEWVSSGESLKNSLSIIDSDLSVVISRVPYRSEKNHTVHSTRPPRVYSDTSNPIYDQLSKKCRQIENAPRETDKTIFLAEVGSSLLAELSKVYRMGVESYSEPRKIITKFLKDKAGRVDVVVVFIPVNNFGSSSSRLANRHWNVTVLSLSSEKEKLWSDHLAEYLARLPAPRQAGYQARSQKLQEARRPKLFRYDKGYEISMSRTESTFRVSARAFRDLLAGELSLEEFNEIAGGERNGPNLAHLFQQGYTISNLELEKADVDSDDDYMVLKFAKDPAASKLE